MRRRGRARPLRKPPARKPYFSAKSRACANARSPAGLPRLDRWRRRGMGRAPLRLDGLDIQQKSRFWFRAAPASSRGENLRRWPNGAGLTKPSDEKDAKMNLRVFFIVPVEPLCLNKERRQIAFCSCQTPSNRPARKSMPA